MRFAVSRDAKTSERSARELSIMPMELSRQKLAEDGFVVIPSVYTATEVDSIRAGLQEAFVAQSEAIAIRAQGGSLSVSLGTLLALRSEDCASRQTEKKSEARPGESPVRAHWEQGDTLDCRLQI